MLEAIKWNYETDIVVVGYGGAGAVTAITAFDLGAKVLILERQPADTATEVRHTPNSRMAGGLFLCATDAQKAAEYLYWTSWGTTPRDCCEVMGKYMVSNESYMIALGGEVRRSNNPFEGSEYRDIAPGADAIYAVRHKGRGPRQFQIFMDHIKQRNIPVLYRHRGKELIQDPETHAIIGIIARHKDTDVYVRARKAVVLATGGFEWNEEMKVNFLRAYPSYFYGNPDNEGDGIKMGQKVGAALWHMNTISARIIPYINEIKVAFGASFLKPFILVNKYGRRFATEPGDAETKKYRRHAFWLECVEFDTQTLEYPHVPCYRICDESTRLKGPFAISIRKGRLPGGKLQYSYRWSRDNLAEIQKGWVYKGGTPAALAHAIARQDPENESRMDAEGLDRTIHNFNQYCQKGVDPEFGRSPSSLVPLVTPPFYAIKMYPGGPNTQGGLKKNAKGQVQDPFGKPIPRLYAPGENGSYFGFLYSGGGNIAENLVWGRISGENAAKEKPLDI